MRPPRAGSPSRSSIATTAWARSPRRSSPRGWPSVRPCLAVIDKVSQFIEAGCTTVVMRFTSPDQQGQFERCLADVMPALRAAVTSSSPR